MLDPEQELQNWARHVHDGWTETDYKQANHHLTNWGRHVHDGWLRDNLLYTPPPTSEGYVAPIVAYDGTEPSQHPIDELDAQLTERIVVDIGLTPEHFDYYRVLVHWYTKIQTSKTEFGRNDCIKLLSKHMRCSYGGAERMLKDAIMIFWRRRSYAGK